MKTIKTLAVVKTGTTDVLMRVPQITVRKDGTLWANKNTMPLTNSSGTLSKDALLPLVQSGAWDKIPADNYLRLGNNPGGKECLDDADLAPRYKASADARPEAEKAYDAVLRAQGAVEAAENASYYSPERIIMARMAADKAAAEWAAKYPEAEKARVEKIEREAAARTREIQSRPGYKAAFEGRD